MYYTSINTLDDDILLGIFRCYLLDFKPSVQDPLVWCKISHVCRRWRNLIHSSPFHLGLQILCTHFTPIVDMLDHLPPIPIFIDYAHMDQFPIEQDEIGICRALRLRDRVRGINISLPHSILDEILMLMDASFPILEHLILSSTVPVTFPKGFVAPNLRYLCLCGIGLPKRLRLLPSLVSLVRLRLGEIGASSYFRPRLLVARLQYLPQLRDLDLEFSVAIPRPSTERELLGKHGPPVTLPNLTHLLFRGVSVYLERLVAQISAPLLERLDITFFNQLAFTLPYLSNFIVRTERLVPHTAAVVFRQDEVTITPALSGNRRQDGYVMLRVTCKPLDWQIDCIAQVCSTLMPALSGVEHLTLDVMAEPDGLVEGTTWQELLRSFTGLKKLYICDKLLGELSSALNMEGLGSDPSFLPCLQKLDVSFRLPSASRAFRSFINARRVAGLPGDFDLGLPTLSPSPSPLPPV